MKIKFAILTLPMFLITTLSAMGPKNAIPTKTEEMQQLFFNAADTGNVETLLFTLEFLIDVNITNPNKETAFMRATLNNHIGIIQAIRQHQKINEFDLNRQDFFGNSALLLAASISDDNANMINELLSFPGLNVSLKNDFGRTVLAIAAKEGRINILNRLLDKNPSQHTTSIQNMANHEDRDGKTPLMLAVDWNKKNTALRLINEEWVDVNHINKFGQTALIIAARAQDLEILTALLDCPRIHLSYQNQGQRALETARYYHIMPAINLIQTYLNKA
jgi:ankyrin repeat protein